MKSSIQQLVLRSEAPLRRVVSAVSRRVALLACKQCCARRSQFRGTRVASNPWHPAFTLIELLVVIMIIGLLVGILMPAVNKFVTASYKAKTQAAINLIDGGCRHYFTDFGYYPPSSGGGWHGSERIVQCLTGYRDAADGKDGYGFRTAQRGLVYGPYNGTEKLDIYDAGSRPEFVDAFGAFGNPILYYRFGGSSYSSGDNTGGPSNVNSYAKTTAGKYYRTDFILISQGCNEEWDAPCDSGSDDVTNFFAD